MVTTALEFAKEEAEAFGDDIAADPMHLREKGVGSEVG